MKKIVLIALFALTLVCTSAVADTGIAYGVYHMEGETPDSLIRATAEVTDGALTSITFDEKLLPVSFGGAEGWDELPADTEADGLVEANNKHFAPAFILDGTTWTVADDLTVANDEKGEFIAYITTREGGDWYFAQESAVLLDGARKEIATVPVGTKASIEHGVHFWVSEITFPGNIKAIEDFLMENGLDFAEGDIAKNADGFWGVADAVSGATLAGTPNYLLLAQAAAADAVK